jgi:hypothetical protein
MSGEIPTSIGNLTNLEELSLSQNQLTGAQGVDPVLHLTAFESKTRYDSGLYRESDEPDGPWAGGKSTSRCVVLHLTLLNSKFCMTSGAIPVHLLRMKAQDETVRLPNGLMLPDDIRDLGKYVTSLDLSGMGLIGIV